MLTKKRNMDDDEYTMTCEHCGRVWDGYAQCQCPGNLGGNILYKNIENLEFYQKLYEDLNTLIRLDRDIPDVNREMVGKLLHYIDSKIVDEQ